MPMKVFAEKYKSTIITKVDVEWIRYHTSIDDAGSDAIHHDCDYSSAQVTLHLSNTDIKGQGIIFCIGKGAMTLVQCVEEFKDLIEGKSLGDIVSDFRGFYRSISQHSQMRWLGPEKGASHLALAGVINSVWDCWAKLEGKPLWRHLSDLTPEQLLTCLEMSYIEDFMSQNDAYKILEGNFKTREGRIQELLTTGYPAYTTAVGWAGYSDEKVIRLCDEAMAQGFQAFKVKVGIELENDMRRVGLVRKCVGPHAHVMTDANQVWNVEESVKYMTELNKFNVTWIEEPTCPDDVMGHAAIDARLKPIGVRVATGEHCSNRILHKQFMMNDGYHFVQMDPVRLGGMSEVLVVMLMAAHAKKPVCLHAGGVGLCEMGIHGAMFDYIGVSASLEERWFEYAGALHEHFETPVQIKNGHYMAPTGLGYASDMYPESIAQFRYPSGHYWVNHHKSLGYSLVQHGTKLVKTLLKK